MKANYTVVTSYEISQAPSHAIWEMAVVILDLGKEQQLRAQLSSIRTMTSAPLFVIKKVFTDISNLRTDFPDVNWILFSTVVSIAEMIDTSVNICKSSFICVIPSTMSIHELPDIGLLAKYEALPWICLTPYIQNRKEELFPSVRIPCWIKNNFSIRPETPDPERSVPDLYPLAYYGLYHVVRYQRLRGFDLKIKNPYWSLVDFGVRSWLLGYTIFAEPRYVLEIDEFHPALQEDISQDDGYIRFAAKNLCVRLLPNGKKKLIHAKPLRKEKLIKLEILQRLELFTYDIIQLSQKWGEFYD